jgi:hypothetical protein
MSATNEYGQADHFVKEIKGRGKKQIGPRECFKWEID